MGPRAVKHSGGSLVPPGLKLLMTGVTREWGYRSYRTSVLVLTFVAYVLYHASRKPSSIVKSVLDSSADVSKRSDELQTIAPSLPWYLHNIFIIKHPQAIPLLNDSILQRTNAMGSDQAKVIGGWAPFDGTSGTARLGEVDVFFLAFYALGMYFAGHLGDRLSLRRFLAIGMVGSGFFVSLFGMAYWWDIHLLPYFFFVQAAAGLFQATGWPSVVAIIGNWFGKRKRGLIMGIWNAHTSVGNVLGSLIAASVLHYGWGWSFLIPGLCIAVGGVLIFLFLVEDPVIIGLPSPYKMEAENNWDDGYKGESTKSQEKLPASTMCSRGSDLANEGIDEKILPLLRDEEAALIDNEEAAVPEQRHAVGFLQACAIPGVAPFAFCLFFSKLVAYTFLYWLPFYIRHTVIQGYCLSDKTAGNMSTIFDVGGVVGGILAGHLSDTMNARAVTAASYMYVAIPVLYLYRAYGSASLWINLILLFMAGFFVNGPYALITTAVSADLGTHSSLKGNSRALATVTAIIDGTGSVGAALGPLITGFISEDGWNSVFTMLMVSAFVSGLLLTRLVIAEVTEKVRLFTRSSTECLVPQNVYVLR
eukprot:c26563_g1_i2 orf=580-2346(-)